MYLFGQNIYLSANDGNGGDGWWMDDLSSFFDALSVERKIFPELFLEKFKTYLKWKHCDFSSLIFTIPP